MLRGARAIAMNGGEVIDDADIVVHGPRIEAVGPRGPVDVPAEATVIDVSGRTVVPGFVDTHAHLRARDELHRTDVWPYLANLAYGVTTTRDPQAGNTEVLSYADRVRAGTVLGPRIYSTGPGVFWQDGIDTEDEARDVLKRYADYFDTKTIKMYVAAARKGRQHIIAAARELGLMPTTERSLNIRQNLTETLDGYPGPEHSIPIFPVYGDYVRLFAETGRVYTPTLLVSYGGPWAENYFYSRENPHDDAKLRRFVPHDEIDARTLRRGQWFRDEQRVRAAREVRARPRRGGRARRRGQPRPVAGPRIPLGTVGDGRGGHEGPRRAAHGHDRARQIGLVDPHRLQEFVQENLTGVGIWQRIVIGSRHVAARQ